MTNHIEEARKIANEWTTPEHFTDLSEEIAAAIAAAEESGRMEERERWLPDVEFLLDRLYDINLDDDTDDLIRDWNGHVDPAIARLRAITKEPTP